MDQGAGEVISTVIQRRNRRTPARKNDGWVRDSIVLGDKEAGIERLEYLRKKNPHLDFRIPEWWQMELREEK